jgi:beta-fructofuranosidase
MGLSIPGKWIWDFWLARENGRHHVFYLQAPRSAGNPELRHHQASVGHAVSPDLRSWQVLADALQPGPPGSWDDLATWTGSVISHGKCWYMLYTGINKAESGLVQRIGLAVSDDLLHWEKHPANPVLQADPTWYELLDLDRWRDQSWRDPWVFKHPKDGSFHALITARSRTGAPGGAGVVGHARSADLVKWEVLPPLTEQGRAAQLEVPQLVKLNGRYQMLVSCLAEDHFADGTELSAPRQTGTFIYSAEEILGPYSYSGGPIAEPDGPLGPLYAGKLIETQGGLWYFMAFRGDGDRSFAGELTDPLPVQYHQDGRIVIDGTRPGHGRQRLADNT